jgi:hypothetical protein
MLSPILPLSVEEAWHFAPAVLKKEDAVFKLGWFEPKPEWSRDDLAIEMEQLDVLKESVFASLEIGREQK